jgi:hypothetical protein
MRKIEIPKSVFLSLLLLFINTEAFSGEPQYRPLMYVEPRTHTFEPVFQGERLSHAFLVANNGEVDLEIKRISHS